MKWKKLGKIFDPTKFKLINNCFEFAQSPQTLVFDEFVRIYFSTREKDKTGKFLSHISFVDFDKEFKEVKNISKDVVISLGDLGCFDEHGIFPMNVVRDKGKVMAYTTGWNRKVSVSADASIGLAVSEDNGLHFEKLGSGPIMTASLTEPFLVCDAFVTIFEGKYHMWYIYGTKWINDQHNGAPQRVYKIAYASSNDGVNWNRDSRMIIPDKLNENECQALPTVIHFNNRYHMFFCYREATGFREIKDRGYRIGYAFSEDMKNWTRDDENVGLHTSNDDWDSDMLCYPHVFHCEDKIYMLYNGNEFGRFGFGLAVLEN
jgi:sucrose-6-phosphate hydrolase SacC (GH32 family)